MCWITDRPPAKPPLSDISRCILASFCPPHGQPLALKVVPRDTPVQLTLPEAVPPTSRELLAVTGTPPPVVTIEFWLPSIKLWVTTVSAPVLLSRPRLSVLPPSPKILEFSI